MSIFENYDDIKKEGSRKSAGKLMNVYVACLRAITIIHQTNHWKCKSPNFYGNHLLFERIYDDANKKLDEAAEKTIGLFGNDSIDNDVQMSLVKKMVIKYSTDNYIENSIKAEEDFIELATKTYEELKSANDITLGLDDLIMAHASQSETSLYLLKQAYLASK